MLHENLSQQLANDVALSQQQTLKLALLLSMQTKSFTPLQAYFAAMLIDLHKWWWKKYYGPKFIDAAALANIAKIKHYLSLPGANINYQDGEGYNALQELASVFFGDANDLSPNQYTITEHLLKQGINVSHFRLGLRAAILQGRVRLIQILLQQPTNRHTTSSQAESMLAIATTFKVCITDYFVSVSEDNISIIKSLLQAKAYNGISDLETIIKKISSNPSNFPGSWITISEIVKNKLETIKGLLTEELEKLKSEKLKSILNDFVITDIALLIPQFIYGRNNNDTDDGNDNTAASRPYLQIKNNT